MKFLGTRLGLRKRPEGRTRMSEAAPTKSGWPSLRGRVDVALDGSEISFRTRKGCAKNRCTLKSKNVFIDREQFHVHQLDKEMIQNKEALPGIIPPQ